MDWIERFFHMFPDGGSGLTEAYVAVALAAAIVPFRRGIPRIGRRSLLWPQRRN